MTCPVEQLASLGQDVFYYPCRLLTRKLLIESVMIVDEPGVIEPE